MLICSEVGALNLHPNVNPTKNVFGDPVILAGWRLDEGRLDGG